MSMLRAAILIAAVLLTAPAAAEAEPVPEIHFRRETPAPRWVVEVAGRAVSFWGERNVVGCTGIQTYQAPTEVLVGWAASARGDGGQGCTIWVSADLVDSASWERFSRVGFRSACQVITQQVGYALGLDYTPTGVMSVAPEPYPGAWAPFFCRQWARWAVAAASAHDARFDYGHLGQSAGL